VTHEASAQVLVFDTSLGVHRDVALGDLTEGNCATAADSAGLACSLMLQEALSDRPSDVELAQKGVFWRDGFGEECLTEGGSRSLAGAC
jgi:hypothetical protein